jgi:hypothetical protein
MAREDYRQLVWIDPIESFKTPPSFLKKFQNWRNIFLYAPRVRYSGVYSVKEKYLRFGIKTGDQQYDPCHLIRYYRYFRFFPDGEVLCKLSTKKMSVDNIIKVMRKSYIEENSHSTYESFHKGEYIIQGEDLFIRLFNKSAVFEYDLKLMQTSPATHDRLIPHNHFMRYVGCHYVPMQRKIDKRLNQKPFKFIYIPQYLEEIEDEKIRAVSY